MPDPLYLSLWFPGFREAEMMPRVLSVLRQIPYSAAKPGIWHVAVHPISWNEAPVFAQAFDFGVDPGRAVTLASEFLHDDYAYEFEAAWDLWRASAQNGGRWLLGPEKIRLLAHGVGFDDGLYQQQGHVQVDFGDDAQFLYEELELTPDVEARVRSNVQKLVNFTTAVEKNCGISGRVLWSESDENLAQKLIARLQKVQ